MSFSIVDTPLPDRPVRPSTRDATWNPGLGAAIIRAPGIEPALARLGLPGALVVTTGQQPGLFTGPCYAVTKALSARALALDLERRWNRPVVPVFWVPGDDHDFAEVATAAWLGGDGELIRESLPERPATAPLTPMFRQGLGEEILPALDRFEASFPDVGTSAPAVSWLRRHYRPEATVSGAFAAAMAELLAPYGILCFDSSHPVAKAAAAPLLLGALAAATDLERELVARSGQLVAQGRDPGVPVGDGASLVFVETEQGRDRLVGGGPGFLTRRGRQEFTLAGLERIAREEPERLSANVLLRPALESALLPTVAYLAGPGELRYLALAAPVYQRLQIHRQTPVPRWSGLLLEPRVTRVLAKFGATLEELMAEGAALESRLTRMTLPEGTDAALAALRADIERGYDPVIRAATAVDPTLERPASAARGQALHAVARLEKKLLQHARKRESVELAQAARARLSVAPLGKPQERVLSMAGFLARYGSGVLDGFAAHLEAWYPHALEAGSPTP